MHKLLNNHVAKFKVHPKFSVSEIEHFFLPRENVIEAWVITSDEKEEGPITDFISFYSLPSSVLKNPNYNDIQIAYAYYMISDTVPMAQLMENALIIAKNKGYDVFNSLKVMGYDAAFESNKFSQGDGLLHYYLYNWRVRDIQTHDIALNFV